MIIIVWIFYTINYNSTRTKLARIVWILYTIYYNYRLVKTALKFSEYYNYFKFSENSKRCEYFFGLVIVWKIWYTLRWKLYTMILSRSDTWHRFWCCKVVLLDTTFLCSNHKKLFYTAYSRIIMQYAEFSDNFRKNTENGKKGNGKGKGRKW